MDCLDIGMLGLYFSMMQKKKSCEQALLRMILVAAATRHPIPEAFKMKALCLSCCIPGKCPQMQIQVVSTKDEPE